jgi:outer membrane protein OmpA-like peptidoglycan-associated protein
MGPSKELRALQTQAGGLKASGPKTQAQRPSTRPEVTPAPQATIALAAPPPVPSKTGMYIGIAAAVVVVIGGGVLFAVNSAQEKQRIEGERIAREAADKADKANKAAAIAAEKARLAEEAAKPVILKATADQLDVKVEAAFKLDGADKTLSGETPWQAEFPRNAKVRFTFTKAGFLPNVQDVISDAAQTVAGKLVPEPKAAPDKPKPVKPKDPGNGETIDVDF